MNVVRSSYALALLLLGCDSGLLPTVSFEQVALRDATFDETALDFTFNVNNPHPIGLSLSSFSYDLQLEAESLFQGSNDVGFDLAASDASPLVVPLVVNYADIWSLIQSIGGQDDIDLALLGDMGFRTPAGEAKLPFQANGSFPAVRPPSLRFVDIRASLQGLTQVVVELDVEGDNPNAVPVSLDGLDYTLQIDSDDVAVGALDTLPIDSLDRSMFTITTELGVVSLGAAVFGALTGGDSIDIQLAGNAALNTPLGVIPMALDVFSDQPVSLTP